MTAAPRIPETLAVLVTRACQLDCVYCQFHRDLPPMSDALLRRSADILLESPTDTPTLIFLGGEPLLRLGKVLQTVDYARARRDEFFPHKDLRFAVTTNGLLLDEKTNDILMQRGVHIHLSLDGSLQERQRPMRGGGAYPTEALEAVFEGLVRRGARFSLHMVVSPDGVERLRRDALDYLKAGAAHVHFQYRVGALWPREAALAYIQEVARFALEARARGYAIDPKEVMDSNEPAIVSSSITVDTDGVGYLGCTVPAMELQLPRLKECNRLGRVDEAGLAELAAAGAGAQERAWGLYQDDPVLDGVMKSNLEMGRLCAQAAAALRRRLGPEIAA